MAASGLVLYLVIAAAELERYCEPRLKSARKREANSLMANRACLKTAQSAGSEPATTGLRPVAQPMLGLSIVKLNLYFQCVVSRAGLEPATHWLKASCSTN